MKLHGIQSSIRLAKKKFKNLILGALQSHHRTKTTPQCVCSMVCVCDEATNVIAFAQKVSDCDEAKGESEKANRTLDGLGLIGCIGLTG
ncbi:hypothetical protein AAC387_Pa10g0343 [Persea americana]